MQLIEQIFLRFSESARGEIVLSRVRIKPKPGVGEGSTATFKYVRSNWFLNSPAQQGHWGPFRIPHKSSLGHLGLWASPAYRSNCEGRMVLRA
ncbi:hypothetical protein HOY82DRAFT_588317 [Tuber indicum]|nr:hypothetical protein HOY82DRAFT_588317 [Tuber indicum]